jgi:N-acetylmuramoyl-L-alanine amidase
MSWLWLLLSMLFLIFGNSVEARVTRAPIASVAAYTADYVNLYEWLRVRSVQPRVQRSGEDFIIATRSATLKLKGDSCRVEINGVAVWLAHAAIARNGSLLIARQDINTTLTPLLFAPKNTASKTTRIKTITLDPGHGGKDPGNQEGAQKEKNLTLQLAKEVRKKLLQAGFNVQLVRDSDRFVDLDDRPAIAQRSRSDLFISLHFNSAPRATGARGIEVYCLAPAGAPSTNGRGENSDRRALPGNLQDPRNILLAYCMQKSLTTRLGVEDRGVRRARWAVLRTTSIPAILVEGGFMSEPGELRKICSDSFRQQQAQAILEGIQAYQRAWQR